MPALKAQGYSLNTTDDAELEEAKAQLLETKPTLLAYEIALIAAGFAVCVGYMLDKRGIPAVTCILLLGALPVAALGLVGGNGAMMVLALRMPETPVYAY